MNKFDKTFEELMEMIAGDAYGGTEGSSDAIGGSDWYAPGDARLPKVLGGKKKKKGKGKKKKASDNLDDEEVTPMQRRFPIGL